MNIKNNTYDEILQSVIDFAEKTVSEYNPENDTCIVKRFTVNNTVLQYIKTILDREAEMRNCIVQHIDHCSDNEGLPHFVIRFSDGNYFDPSGAVFSVGEEVKESTMYYGKLPSIYSNPYAAPKDRVTRANNIPSKSQLV